MFPRLRKPHGLDTFGSLKKEIISRLIQKRLILSFRKAANDLPAYNHFLKEQHVPIQSIRTIQDFQKYVPVIDKDGFLRLHSLNISNLCLNGDIKNVKIIVSSSGHSGKFSYGLTSLKDKQKTQEAIDFVLDATFNVSKKRTLLINALAMGIKIHSALVTVADTSVRTDIVIDVIKTFSHLFDQTILVGDNAFIKKTLEEGLKEGLDWKNMKLHLVLGEELLPENLRTYFADIIGSNPDSAETDRLIGSSLGVAEFGLNIFYETHELIRIRRLMQRDEALRKKLIGFEPACLPALFQYNPLMVFVETFPKENQPPDIILTNLDEDAVMPLIRYNVKDEGVTIPFQDLKIALLSLGYKDYVPKLALPIVAVLGRDKLHLGENSFIRPEFIKELLFQNKYMASQITGNFRISAGTKTLLKLEIQSKQDAKLTLEFEEKLRNLLLENLPAKTEIIIYPYKDFPYAMELSFEKKFQYI